MKPKSIKVWAVQHPDGKIYAEWCYGTKEDLFANAPGGIYGDCSLWSRAYRAGYRCVPVTISMRRKT